MSNRNFDKLFHPKTVALIGAGDRRRAGFQGELLPVNPLPRTLDGRRGYPDSASLPHPPDLAVIATPPATVPCLVAELGASGTRAAVVITAGFGELGERGRALQ